jgi:hypothetical protein
LWFFRPGALSPNGCDKASHDNRPDALLGRTDSSRGYR